MKKRLYGEDQMTRAELAKAIGKSKTTIRRWEAEGRLKPSVNERGVRLYRVADAKRLDANAVITPLPQARAHAGATVERASVSDEVAAQVFDLLTEGVAPVKVVGRLRLHPNIVEDLLATWVRLRRGLFLTPTQVRSIGEAFQMRIGDSDELVRKLLLRARQQKSCGRCKESPPMFCHHCFEQELDEALRESRKPVPRDDDDKSES